MKDNPLNLVGEASKKKENSRSERDFYSTPPLVTQALIDTGLFTKTEKVWEPACGKNMMVDVLRSNGFDVVGTDIASGTDFLTTQQPNSPIKQLITNPPFYLSEEFIYKCIDLRIERFALLLKSQYWHSSKRMKLFQDHQPAWVMPLTWRPDFNFGERGGNPTMECVWTVWLSGIGYEDCKYQPLKKPRKTI